MPYLLDMMTLVLSDDKIFSMLEGEWGRLFKGVDILEDIALAADTVHKKFDRRPTIKELGYELSAWRDRVKVDKDYYTLIQTALGKIEKVDLGEEEKEHLEDKITNFIRRSSFKRDLLDIVKRLDVADAEEVRDTILKSIGQDDEYLQKFSRDSLYEYTDIMDRFSLWDQEEKDTERLPTGIKRLDNSIGGGIMKGGLNVLMSCTGVGKCLGKGTKVVMFDGSFRNVEDVVSGELLMGEDSTPRKVLSTCKGKDQLYKIKQKRGVDYVVNSEHILTLKYTEHIGKTGNWGVKKGQKIWRDPKSGTVIDICLQDYFDLSKKKKHLLKGFKVPIDFPHKKVLLDPYFIGLWLGDGNSRDQRIWTGDVEVSQYLYDYAEELDMVITEYSGSGCRGYSIRLPDEIKFKAKNVILQALRKYGILENKRIPVEYLRNSREVRMKVLAGLVDSDGYVGKSGSIQITQKRKELLYDIVYLARSLGFYVSAKKTVKTIKKRNFSGVYWTTLISGNTSEIPVLVERKKASPRKIKKDPLRTGFTIEALGEGDYYGFELDGNGRFLLEDFTVTHNTAGLVHFSKVALLHGYTVLFVTLELPKKAISARFDLSLTGKLKREITSDVDFFEAMEKALKKYRGRLIIHSFPTYSIKVKDIDRLYEEVNTKKGFYPDFVAVDYGDLLQPSRTYKEKRWELSDIFQGLKGWAMDRDLWLWTPTQANREARKKGFLDVDDMAEAIMKADHSDLVVGLARPNLEDVLAGLSIAKSRLGPTGYKWKILQDLERMQFMKAEKSVKE